MLKRALAAALIIVTLLAAPSRAAAESAGCPKELELANLCSMAIDNDNSTLELDVTRTTPGSNPGSSPIGSGTPGDHRPSAPLRDQLCERSITHLRLCPETPTPADPATAPPTSPGLPPITITDLAQFSPPPTPLLGEPANVGVAGMPTNFVAPASVTTASGTLFGLPIAVRFTPSAFDFHYGDGTTTTTTTTGGQSWSALSQAQFTPTATSHTYRDRGTYSADVDVRYTAEIDLGAGWFPVAGELTADGPPQQIRIFEAHTALVARTCTEQPTAPGC